MNRYRGIELKLSGGKLHDGVGLICSRKQGKGGKRWMNMLFSGEALNLHSNKANPLREREIHWAPGSPQCYRDIFKHHLSLTLLNSIVILHFEVFFLNSTCRTCSETLVGLGLHSCRPILFGDLQVILFGLSIAAGAQREQDSLTASGWMYLPSCCSSTWPTFIWKVKTL